MDQNRTDSYHSHHQKNIMNLNDDDQLNNSEKKKWKCLTCTYDNWPSSIKCTICLTSKSVLSTNTVDLNTTAESSAIYCERASKNKLIIKKKIPPNNNNNNNNNILRKTKQKSDDDYLTNRIQIVTNSCLSSSEENITTSTTTATTTTTPNNKNIETILDENNEIIKQNTNNENDIYKIANLEINKPRSTSCTTSSSGIGSNGGGGGSSCGNGDVNNQVELQSTLKWSCSICTYLNWPKSVKCVQCYTPKIDDNNNNNNNNNSDKLNGDKRNSPLNRSLCNSPCTVPKSKQSNIEVININDSSVINSAITVTNNNNNNTNNNSNNNNNNNTSDKKWSCSACTYQNWPKSQRCVMCHIARNIAINTTTTSTTTSNTTTNSNNATNATNTTTNNNNIKTKNVNTQKSSNLNRTQQINQLNKIKNYQIQIDRLFLSACQGIVDGDMTYLNRYMNAGGDITRYLTSDEVRLLNKPHIFTVGITLIHLCCQFKRKDFLIKLINKTTNNNGGSCGGGGGGGTQACSSSSVKILNAYNKSKFSPCQSCPSLASNIIDRYFSATLRQRKTNSRHYLNDHLIGATNAALFTNSPTSSLISLNSNTADLVNPTGCTGLSKAAFCIGLSPSPSPPPGSLSSSSSFYSLNNSNNGASSSTQSCALCYYVNESHTFTLPNEIEDFSPKIQHILFDELLDRDVQNELEYESRIINWNMDLCKRLNSRLYPLWNRHSGDCLLDSVLQACFGVFDNENILRRVMAESLEQYSNCFKPRWKEHEVLMAQSLGYKLDDYQLEQDWNNILSLANQPGASLEQAHIFALCHIFRRPIIVYSVKYVKSFRGENIGFAHFEGVYLPLIWEPSFCFKSPIALGYTRGHFTALVPFEKSEVPTYIANFNGITSVNSDTLNTTTNNSNNNINNIGNSINNNSSSNHNINSINNEENNLTNNENSESNLKNLLNHHKNNPMMNSNSNSNLNDKTESNENNCGSGINIGGGVSNNNCNKSNSNSNLNLLGAVSQLETNDNHQQLFYLPLTNNEGHLLPVHFLTSSELGRERSILRQYLNLDCLVMQGSNYGLLVAQQRVAKRGMLVKQMLDEWLNYYRNMQAKEFGQQIEISQEQENDDFIYSMNQNKIINLNDYNKNNNTNSSNTSNNNNSNNKSNNSMGNNSNNKNNNNNNSITNENQNQIEVNEDDDDDDDEDSDDDDEDEEEEDDDDDDDEDEDDDEYVNVQ